MSQKTPTHKHVLSQACFTHSHALLYRDIFYLWMSSSSSLFHHSFYAFAFSAHSNLPHKNINDSGVLREKQQGCANNADWSQVPHRPWALWSCGDRRRQEQKDLSPKSNTKACSDEHLTHSDSLFHLLLSLYLLFAHISLVIYSYINEKTWQVASNGIIVG